MTRLHIDSYPDVLLRSLIDWIKSDEQLRANDELVDEMVHLLGYQRRWARIVKRLSGIVERVNARPVGEPADDPEIAA